MEGACLQTSDEMDRPTPTQTETEAQAETQSESLQCPRRLLAAETSVVGLLVTFNECTEPPAPHDVPRNPFAWHRRP